MTRGEYLFARDHLEEELDPCLRAAVNCKFTHRHRLLSLKYVIFCFIIFLAVFLLTIGFFVFSTNLGTREVTTTTTTQNSSSSSTSSTIITTTNSPENTKFANNDFFFPPFSSSSSSSPFIFSSSSSVATTNTTTTTTKSAASVATTPRRLRPIPKIIKLPPIGHVIDCEQHRRLRKRSGTYKLSVPNYGDFYAYCEMEEQPDNNGWIVLQRRTSGKWPFWNATFEEYSYGFGDQHDGDHWLGLDRVHAFVNVNRRLEMRIRLRGDLCPAKACSGLGDSGSWWGDWAFTIANREDFYRISGLRFVRGNLSDTEQPEKDLFTHLCNNQRFTTVDVDNDQNEMGNCAAFRNRGAWWHSDCAYTTLNGLYNANGIRPSGQFWHLKSSVENGTHKSYAIKPMQSLMLFRVVKEEEEEERGEK